LFGFPHCVSLYTEFFNQKLLRNKFVTGEWGSEDAEKLLMEDEESDADGDFEDLEIASCRFFAHLSVSFLVILVFLAEHKAEESPRDGYSFYIIFVQA
jgi:hypothetical protein